MTDRGNSATVTVRGRDGWACLRRAAPRAAADPAPAITQHREARILDSHNILFDACGRAPSGGASSAVNRVANFRTRRLLRYRLDKRSTVMLDYQFIADPAYNADRGPVNVFATRYHWEY